MTVDLDALQAALAQMTPGPWRQTYAYNNAGMPTADFYIPGHNGNATVEMLAGDAAGIVENVAAAPELIKEILHLRCQVVTLEANARTTDAALREGFAIAAGYADISEHDGWRRVAPHLDLTVARRKLDELLAARIRP